MSKDLFITVSCYRMSWCLSDLQHIVVKSVAPACLMVYGEDSSALLSTLIRMVLSGSSRSTVCLMQSMLAVSSVYLHGLQAQSIKYHTAALRTMRAAVDHGLAGVEPCEHVAAAMLLGSYEVCSRTSVKFYILPAHQECEHRRAS